MYIQTLSPNPTQVLTMTRRSLSRESLPLVRDCRLMTALTKPQNWVLVVAFQHTLQL